MENEENKKEILLYDCGEVEGDYLLVEDCNQLFHCDDTEEYSFAKVIKTSPPLYGLTTETNYVYYRKYKNQPFLFENVWQLPASEHMSHIDYTDRRKQTYRKARQLVFIKNDQVIMSFNNEYNESMKAFMKKDNYCCGYDKITEEDERTSRDPRYEKNNNDWGFGTGYSLKYEFKSQEEKNAIKRLESEEKYKAEEKEKRLARKLKKEAALNGTKQ